MIQWLQFQTKDQNRRWGDTLNVNHFITLSNILLPDEEKQYRSLLPSPVNPRLNCPVSMSPETCCPSPKVGSHFESFSAMFNSSPDSWSPWISRITLITFTTPPPNNSVLGLLCVTRKTAFFNGLRSFLCHILKLKLKIRFLKQQLTMYLIDFRSTSMMLM